jgi:sortase A
MMRAVRATGSLLLTVGVLILLLIAYQLWGTGFAARRAQHRLGEELERVWSDPSRVEVAPAALHLRDGRPFAILTIPRLGRNYREVVVEGVSTEDLRQGPGHYPGSALPGQVGDFAVAGHRTTYGAPFGDINLLRAGDAVDVRVANIVYEYTVTGHEIVRPSDVAVVAPLPDYPGRAPTHAMLTLTTCNPKYSAQQRLVVHAVLARVTQVVGRM